MLFLFFKGDKPKVGKHCATLLWDFVGNFEFSGFVVDIHISYLHFLVFNLLDLAKTQLNHEKFYSFNFIYFDVRQLTLMLYFTFRNDLVFKCR